MWIHHASVGFFKIVKQTNGQFALYIGNNLLGAYPSPQAAADAVYRCETGYWPWDQQLTVEEPKDLSFWTPVM